MKQRVVDIRAATPEDAEAVADLVHAAYRSEESRYGWTTEADLVGGQRTDVEMVRDLAAGQAGVVLVAVTRDEAGSPQVVACCHLEPRGKRACLGMFAVRPREQGRGIGRRMLAGAEAHARRSWGSTSLEITVLDARPELIAWYERCGFTMTGDRKPFPYDDERFGVPRRAGLELLVMARPIGASAGQAGAGTAGAAPGV